MGGGGGVNDVFKLRVGLWEMGCGYLSWVILLIIKGEGLTKTTTTMYNYTHPSTTRYKITLVIQSRRL